jgi:phage baseplate assembly protein W
MEVLFVSRNEERWGTDLRLLRNLENQNDRERGQDLATYTRFETGQVDLATLSGADNLKQALLMRFLTPLGELAVLGHRNYGSGLFRLIGELNTETNRNRAKLYVLQALNAEPRVKKVNAVRVIQNRANPNRMDIDVSLTAIDSDTTLNLVFPFFLDGGAVS